MMRSLHRPCSSPGAGSELARSGAGWCHGIITHTCPTASPWQCHHCSPTSGPLLLDQHCVLGSLGPALAGAAPKLQESDRNIAACVGCPQAGNCLLPTAWHLQCPALSVTTCPMLWWVTNPTVKGSAVGSSGSQGSAPSPSLYSRLPNPLHLGWKRAFLERGAQRCFCSQHPAVDCSAISLTSSLPADSCAQSHLLLHAGDPGTHGLG